MYSKRRVPFSKKKSQKNFNEHDPMVNYIPYLLFDHSISACVIVLLRIYRSPRFCVRIKYYVLNTFGHCRSHKRVFRHFFLFLLKRINPKSIY